MRNHHLLTRHLELNYFKLVNKQWSFKFSHLALPELAQENPSVVSSHICRTKRRVLAHLLQQPVPENDDHSLCYERALHAQIITNGLESDTFLANILLKRYWKCGRLYNASNLFDKMTERNLISWSTMVSMYSQHGYSQEALMLFCGFLKSSDGRPNEYILASVIRACSKLDSDFGGLMHGFVTKSGFEQDVYVGTSLVDLYAKKGCIDEAKLVFDGLVIKSAVTWTTIITGYVKSGKSDVSLKLFNQMRETDVVPDKYVLSSMLSACSMLEFIEGGKQVHAYVLRRGTEMDISVVNVLIDFYAKCSRVKMARRLFDKMVIKNVISWTTMIAGYMQNSFNREAMILFAEMTKLGYKPDAFACTSVLTSCGSLEALEQGRQVHAYTVKANLGSDDFVKNGLVDMYAKCGSLPDARVVFDHMVDRNVVSYNAMIEGYARQEKLAEAMDLFHEMRLGFVPPSLLTFVSLIGVSATLVTLELSKQIHGLLIKYGVLLNLLSGSALIDVYSKCSCIKDARKVFEEMDEKDIVVWNAMLFGYTQQLENEEVLKLYLELQLSEQTPNEYTFAALITAASNLASLRRGQQFHSHLIRLGLDSDPFVTNALIDMYAKCGGFEEAHKSFNSTIWRDVACWNSMISTYAHHGEAEEALLLFEEMTVLGLKPNYVTFVGILSACSHAGLVEEGLRYFELMNEFEIEPGTDHYACVVSLFGRSGKLNEAREFIEKMPIKPAAVVWRSLLSACRIAGNVEMGKYAAEMAISIDPMDSGSYTLLSNILACKGMWNDVKRVRERMDSDGVMKEPGRSWIEVNNEVHSFVAKDKTHSETSLTYSILDNLILQIKGVGYALDTTAPLLND